MIEKKSAKNQDGAAKPVIEHHIPRDDEGRVR